MEMDRLLHTNLARLCQTVSLIRLVNVIVKVVIVAVVLLDSGNPLIY